MRFFVSLALVAIAALAPAAASAAAPEIGTFDNGSNSFVDTEVCAEAPWGFDVMATEHEYGRFQVFRNGAGETVRVAVHFNYDASISANGIRLRERDTWTTFFTADGSRNVGLTVHIQGPGGIVMRDAGQIVWDLDGNVRFIRGPHEQFSDASFCPALAG